MRGDHDDRSLAEGRNRADHLADLHTVDVGQAQVEKDAVGDAFLGQFDALAAEARDVELLVAGRLEPYLDELHPRLIVLDNQYLLRHISQSLAEMTIK